MDSLTQRFQPKIIIWAYPMAEIWKAYSLLPYEVQVSDDLQHKHRDCFSHTTLYPPALQLKSGNIYPFPPPDDLDKIPCSDM